MSVHALLPGNSGGIIPPVRTEPVQGRSAARIDALLDAAAAVVDEVGFDRLTTALVAERADASIGTLYRYFPDRIALLQALRDRVVSRYRSRVVALFRREKPHQWWEAVDCAAMAFVEMFREEPGYRIIRFSDEERAASGEAYEYHSGYFAARFAEILSEEFGLPKDDRLEFRLGIAVEIGYSLISRAFIVDRNGDQSVIDEARLVVRAYLHEHYGSE